MNKKEVNEIKKIFTPETAAIDRICVCYVNAEKETVFQMSVGFGSVLDEEVFKYMEIFKKTLSGKIGKTLINLDVPAENETEQEGPYATLTKMRDSGLNDETAVNGFYRSVIDNYAYPDNYIIILIHGVYDVPTKTKNNETLDDASETVYDYILCSLCPMRLSEDGLAYNSADGRIENNPRNMMVRPPMNGFLFPAFDNRESNIHSILYFTKNSEELMDSFVNEVLGCELMKPASEQNDAFVRLCDELSGGMEYYATVSLFQNINGLVAQDNADNGNNRIDREDIKRLLDSSGIDIQSDEHFDEVFDDVMGKDDTLMLNNISNDGKFVIETPVIRINASPKYVDLIREQVINGKKCIVIDTDGDIEINGIKLED